MSRVVAMALMLVALAAAACGNSGGRPAASSRPRDDEIKELTGQIWAAVGVADDDVAVGDYQYHHPFSDQCGALPPEDHWLGERSSYIAADTADAGEAEAAIVGFLAAEGFAVQSYRSTNPASTARSFEATKDEIRVYGYLGEGSPTDVNVRIGPCAPFFGASDPDRWEPDPLEPDA